MTSHYVAASYPRGTNQATDVTDSRAFCILWLSYQSNLVGYSSLVNPHGRWKDVGERQEGERKCSEKGGKRMGDAVGDAVEVSRRDQVNPDTRSPGPVAVGPPSSCR